MSCTPGAVVCDDAPATGHLWLEVALSGLLLALVALAVVLLLRRRRRPRSRPALTPVWVSANGDVVMQLLTWKALAEGSRAPAGPSR